MLFKKKKCPQCESQYDVAEETCPVCHADNEDFVALKVPKHQVWIDWPFQLLLFVFGFVLLNAVSFILSMFLKENSVQNVMIINASRYGVVAAAMACLLIGRYHKFKKSFTNWLPYVVGLAGGILLIGFSLLYGNIINAIYPTTPNENQQLVNSLVKAYPVLSILLLGIIGPIVEEFTFRVGLFSLLSRVHRAVAYIVVIIVFALIHFSFMAPKEEMINELLNLPSYIIAGAALCFLYDRFGLSASITAHVLNNLISIIFVLLSSLAK